MKKKEKFKDNNRKNKMGSGDMIAILLHFIKKLSDDFYADIIAKIKEHGIEINRELDMQFSKEVAIIHFWIVSLVLSSDRQLLDKLHDTWLSYLSIVFHSFEIDKEVSNFFRQEKERLNKRYKEYYKKMHDKNGLMLPQAMLINMLSNVTPRKKLDFIKYDIRLLVMISGRVFETMNVIRKIREDIEIKD